MTDVAATTPPSVKAAVLRHAGPAADRAALEGVHGQSARLLSAIVFLVLFVVSLFAELIANDRPILVCTTAASTCRSSRIIRKRRSAARSRPTADYHDPYRPETDR